MPAKKPRISPEPLTLQEAIEYYADPQKALEFFVAIRWPEGVTCPYCEGKEHSFISTRRTWACKACKKRFSVKVGTLMEESPLPLKTWIGGIWMMTNCKNGVSSHEIHRELGITQKSAWFLMHRIRLALQQGSFEKKLSGEVEADETFIGQKARNMHASKRAEKIKGRGPSGKTIVLGLLDRTHGEKPSQVRATVVTTRKKHELHTQVRAHVEPGSFLFTDELKSYEGLTEFEHQVINHAEAYVRGNVHTNGMENFWSLLKRSIKGTYVSVEPFHLFRYLDEQSFRFNERKGNNRGRFRKAAQGITGKRLTYKQLTGKNDTENREGMM
jgi:transposase-like protein